MDLLLIGGVSGSGKSVALAAFEDAGYYAVNNLPVPLVVRDGRLSGGRRTAARRRRARRQDGARTARTVRRDRRRSRSAAGNVRFIFLDATVETLVKRFSETRRRHPFSSDDRTLTEAIEYERDLLADARQLGMPFDTSGAACGGPARLDQGLRVGRSVATDAAARVVRLQARPAARRRHSCSTCAACPIRITSRRCRR